MKNKAVRIFLNAALSIAVFFGIALLTVVVLSWTLGSTTGADGQEVIKGGSLVSLIVLGMSAAVTTAFAIWFNKFLTNRKATEVNEAKNVGE